LTTVFTRRRFDEFLLYRLDRQRDDFAGPDDDYPTSVRRVVEEANAGLWWRDLLRAARAAVPADAGLQELADRFDVAPVTVVPNAQGGTAIRGHELELKIIESQSTFDIGPWRRRLGEIEGRVCRVEYPSGMARGTGFLIGPNRVLTNYHVVEKVIDGNYQPAAVKLRFDYLVGGDGVAVSAGTAYDVAADWLLDSSPYSAQDSYSQPPADPDPEELDYAVLKTEIAVGNEPVGGPTDDPEPAVRGWISTPAEPYAFTAGSALYIVQHPDGQPMQVAVDSQGVLGENGNQTRVRYTTTTQPGSSGSPCFAADWQLVAVHHGGDPKYATTSHADFNQGIPVTAIRQLLTARNHAGAFGPEA
jgi:hypothetical protein